MKQEALEYWILQKTNGAVSEKAMKSILKAFREIIISEVADGEEVTFPGLGTFYLGRTPNRSYTMPSGKITHGNKPKMGFRPFQSIYKKNKFKLKL